MSAKVRRRRRVAVGVAVLVLGALAAVLLLPVTEKAVQEVTLPLHHEDIIRQQARAKHLDPALIAAVIYAETKFRARTSSAGAQGLMQVTPDTARFIAHRSGGTSFRESDLSDPQINIQYGTYYLRYLLDRYGGNETLALAAYNGGEGNVDRWLVRASKRAQQFTLNDIPFPETRAYVTRVEQARSDYADTYRSELGL
ncbi:MAG TPA: lytic transglycosylase domain-containing protein [Solirubrobacteraceae bacterium]|jgi:soluble lytic murein transglycosylase|nr:lytic transglycosylase domain-containing protein [Solirubrobacteraceae bacterium]